MRISGLMTVTAIALALSACGKKDEPAPEATNGGDAAMSAPSDAAPAMASPAQAFANAAAASDNFEIETSKLAADKAASAKVKSFAQQMIKMHTESTAKLKTAAASAMPAITPDPQLDAMQQQTLADLQSKSGADFDTTYTKAQVDGHQMTLDKLKAYSTSGDAPSLKSFATEMVPVVTAHLNMAKGL